MHVTIIVIITVTKIAKLVSNCDESVVRSTVVIPFGFP